MSTGTEPSVIYTVGIPPQYVYKLTEKDFALETAERIVLREITDCIIILFHTENEESRGAMTVWLDVAAKTAGPIFAAVNVMNEREVGLAFTRLAMEKNHPLHHFCLRGYPFILTYQKRYPVGFYNAVVGSQEITDFALTFACQGDYLETRNLYAGQIVDSPKAIEGNKMIEDLSTKLSTEYANVPGLAHRRKTTETATRSLPAATTPEEEIESSPDLATAST